MAGEELHYDVAGREYTLDPPDDLGCRDRRYTGGRQSKRRETRRLCSRHGIDMTWIAGSKWACAYCDREDYERKHGV